MFLCADLIRLQVYCCHINNGQENKNRHHLLRAPLCHNFDNQSLPAKLNLRLHCLLRRLFHVFIGKINAKPSPIQKPPQILNSFVDILAVYKSVVVSFRYFHQLIFPFFLPKINPIRDSAYQMRAQKLPLKNEVWITLSFFSIFCELITFQFSGQTMRADTLQRFGFDLSYPLARYPELAPHFLQRVGNAVVQPETHR